VYVAAGTAVLLEVTVITVVVDAATEVIGAELVVAVPAGTVMVTLPLRQNFPANCMVASSKMETSVYSS